jgi:hypothetical protein
MGVVRAMPGIRIAMLVLAIAVAFAACGQAAPSPMPTAVAAQRHACGNLAPDMCEEVIALVVRKVPAMAGSPIVVTATRDPDAQSRRGGDLEVLVAFAPPADDSDLWFNPPAWIVTRTMLTNDWRVDPWRGDRLPAHFLTLLRAAGLPI